MYLFVLSTPVGGQFIIDIYSADGSRLVATTLAVESPLPKPASVTTLDYAAGQAAALRAWFPAASRELIGAFPIARAAGVPRMGSTGAGTVTPLPVATSGRTALFETMDEGLGPHQHLTTALRVIAARATARPSGSIASHRRSPR